MLKTFQNNSLEHPKEKADFIRLFNKMLTGNINEPNKVNENGFVSNPNPNEITQILKTFRFGTEKSEMIKNLKK